MLEPIDFLKLVSLGVHDEGRHLGAALDADPAPRVVTVYVTFHDLSPLLLLPHPPLAEGAGGAEQADQAQHERDGEHCGKQQEDDENDVRQV